MPSLPNALAEHLADRDGTETGRASRGGARPRGTRDCFGARHRRGARRGVTLVGRGGRDVARRCARARGATDRYRARRAARRRSSRASISLGPPVKFACARRSRKRGFRRGAATATRAVAVLEQSGRRRTARARGSVSDEPRAPARAGASPRRRMAAAHGATSSDDAIAVEARRRARRRAGVSRRRRRGAREPGRVRSRSRGRTATRAAKASRSGRSASCISARAVRRTRSAAYREALGVGGESARREHGRGDAPQPRRARARRRRRRARRSSISKRRSISASAREVCSRCSRRA